MADYRYPTQSLFLEYKSKYKNRTPDTKYTLKDEADQGFPSLYRLYLDMDDPTEFLFAEKYFKGWSHWEALCASEFFQPHLLRMRDHLAKKNRALAIQNLKLVAVDPTHKNHYLANKYLAEVEIGSTPPAKRKVGRPLKEKISPMEPSAEKIKQDLQRIAQILQ